MGLETAHKLSPILHEKLLKVGMNWK